MSTKKIFVILENSFEYNDQTHYPPESGGGHPVVYSEDKAAIEKECEERNLAKFLSEFETLNDWSEDFSYAFSEEAQALLEKMKISTTSGYNWEFKSIDNYSEKNLRALFEGFDVRWFSVYEVDQISNDS